MVIKFRRNGSDNGYGHGDDFTAECFGCKNSEIEDNKYRSHELFVCVHCEGDVEVYILTKIMLGNFQVP